MQINSIRARYLETLSHVSSAIGEFPWEDRRSYVNWLAQSYYFVRHSTRLLASAAANCSFSKNQTHKRMGRHIFEEIGHEILAANDLRSLGININDISEHPLTKAFYRLQYFGIEKMGPIYLMGYILFLEGLASIHGPKMLQRVSNAHGSAATTFLKLHVEEDIGHVESAFKNIELTETSDAGALLESLEISCSLYTLILKNIIETTARNQITERPLAI